MLVWFGQVAAFSACLALGFTVRSADVHCALEAVRVPLPVAQQQNVPCDAEEREARRPRREGCPPGQTRSESVLAPSSGGTAAARPRATRAGSADLADSRPGS